MLRLRNPGFSRVVADTDLFPTTLTQPQRDSSCYLFISYTSVLSVCLTLFAYPVLGLFTPVQEAVLLSCFGQLVLN